MISISHAHSFMMNDSNFFSSSLCVCACKDIQPFFSKKLTNLIWFYIAVIFPCGIEGVYFLLYGQSKMSNGMCLNEVPTFMWNKSYYCFYCHLPFNVLVE